MKFVLGKGLSKTVYKLFSVTTIIFAVLGFCNLENWFLRIFTQGSLCFNDAIYGYAYYFTPKR